MHVCLTQGRIEARGPGRFRVAVGAMRATAGTSGDAAEVAFTYGGPSPTTNLLADGELRRQIGLKLRAQDTCNTLYVMWHIEPSPGIFVTLKRNAGSSTHARCGDRGYVELAPNASAPVDPIRPGQAHRLRAEMHGDQLEVIADGRLAWKGRVPSAALELDGPAGIRSDNGLFDFELRVPGGQPSAPGCRTPYFP